MMMTMMMIVENLKSGVQQQRKPCDAAEV